VNDGHRTSSIARPRAARVRTAPPTVDGTRFGDFTRPIAREKQLVKGRGKRTLIGVGTLVIAGALLAALFVLPIKSWYRQRDDIAVKQRELAVLTAANAQLGADVTRLQTSDGIAEAAREEIGFVPAGEQRDSVMPAPNAPLTLPTGWPYDAVTQILAVRTAQAAAAAVPATTVVTPVP
jgi:cell division protein FtsB